MTLKGNSDGSEKEKGYQEKEEEYNGIRSKGWFRKR